MKRIFIAINLKEEIEQELENIQKEIVFEEGVVKWVKKDNFHITLGFLGNMKEEDILRLIEKTKETFKDTKPFTLKTEKVCYDNIPPKIIWVEVKENEIVKNNPHITLGRIRTWAWKRIEIEERPEIERDVEIEFEVDSIEIMESVLKRQGPEYKILHSIKL